MMVESLTAVVRALGAGQVRYWIVGGVAVIAHGFQRMTNDLDVVIDLEPENVRRALEALKAEGYCPAVPVRFEDFADAEKRASWMREKQMLVLQLVSDRHRALPIDVFVREPFDVVAEESKAIALPLGPMMSARVVSLATLRRLKEAAGRPQDLIDLQRLDELARLRSAATP